MRSASSRNCFAFLAASSATFGTGAAGAPAGFLGAPTVAGFEAEAVFWPSGRGGASGGGGAAEAPAPPVSSAASFSNIFPGFPPSLLGSLSASALVGIVKSS